MGEVFIPKRGRPPLTFPDPNAIFGEDLYFFSWGDDPGAYTLGTGTQIDDLHNLSLAVTKSGDFSGSTRPGAPSGGEFPTKVTKDGNIAALFSGGNDHRDFFEGPGGWNADLSEAESFMVLQKDGLLTTGNDVGFHRYNFTNASYPVVSTTTIRSGFFCSASVDIPGAAVPFTDKHLYHEAVEVGVGAPDELTAYYDGGNLLHTDATVTFDAGASGPNFGWSDSAKCYFGWLFVWIVVARKTTTGERNAVNSWLESVYPSLTLTSY